MFTVRSNKVKSSYFIIKPLLYTILRFLVFKANTIISCRTTCRFLWVIVLKMLIFAYCGLSIDILIPCLSEWLIFSENEIDWTSPDHSCPHFPVPICTTFFQGFWSETFFCAQLLHASALHNCKRFSLLSLGWLSHLKLVFQHFHSSHLSVLYASLAVNI